MGRSLFPDDDKQKKTGIGGLAPRDSLVRSEQSAVQSLGSNGPDSLQNRPLKTRSAEAIPRGEQYADIYTLHGGNHKYLTGQRNTPSFDALGYLVVLAVFGILGLAIPLMSQNSARRGGRSDITFILLTFGVITVGTLLALIYRWLEHRAYVNKGQLLIGEIYEAHGTWRSNGKSRDYEVELRYTVTMPDGTTRVENVKRRNNRLARQPLPEEGTRLAVLYIQGKDKLYVL